MADCTQHQRLGERSQVLNTNKVGADDCCNLPVAVKCLRQTAKPSLLLLLWVFVRVHREHCAAAQTTEFSHFIGSHGTRPHGKHRNLASCDPSVLGP